MSREDLKTSKTKTQSMIHETIPTVSLSPFSIDDDEEASKERVTETIRRACEAYGFFQVVDHGVPLHLTRRALQLSRAFFARPYEDKLMSKPVQGSRSPLPAGYARQPVQSADKNEYLLMFSPESGFNVYPSNPPQFREVMEELFHTLSKTASVVEGILNKSMGLPCDALHEFNKGCDFMTALHYFPATVSENNGISQHEDGNFFTFVFQDDVGGLEVLKDNEWIPVVPDKGAIVVNIGDIIQVLSNGKFKSATHRVIRKEGKARYSFAYFSNIDPEKWLEPLPQFTEDAGEAPKYRRFFYKEYLQLRMRNKTHPPSRPEDAIDISYYAV